MPADRSRINNPQGRQKACSECAKAKRRCDLRQPSCVRCSRQKLSCTYPPQPHSDASPASQDDSVLPDALGSHDTFPYDTQIPSNDQDVGLLEFDPTIGIDSVSALDDLIAQDVEDSYPLVRPSYMPGKELSPNQVSTFSRVRIEYCIEQWKLTPAMMVSQNCTHWSHPLLYEEHMPRSMQETDAHAACALHVAKNDTNKSLVARHLIDRARELIALPAPTAPVEVLARAQALMLYLLVFVFSGDTGYHNQDDIYLPYIEEMGNALNVITQREVDPIGPLPIYPSAAAQVAWKAFIFRESTRRTMLAVFQFIAMYNLVRGRLAVCNTHLAVGHRITLSAYLWKATNAFDFAIAWREKKHFLVKEMDLTDLFETARPDDIDPFGKVLLTSIVGIDDMRGWYHTRGGVF
ncbi:hypothetical protein K491DRAFT_603185 [Lophiostoma macrostomum CBS 122681]|uniref:Zn(2)-C6 fungal-type domain-containing protein n=1 Tax=Lophiostoma macrostomum CBS 122681 TaxID=1314788 RepID=A0A6A6T276_9PLEO|nr:hypothetical protein K491DRAFT_603185 [Lophiostoma macrostomum CBS 122681]